MPEKVSSESSSKTSFLTRARENPWMVSTIVLGIFFLIALFIATSSPGMGLSLVSEDEISEKVLETLNAQTGGGVTLDSISEESGLYKVTVIYQGDSVPVYVTRDGTKLAFQLLALDGTQIANTAQAQQPQEVPKSDKPTVELFVMSYCPYGTQMEKAMLPVVSLLKDKIDFKLRYTHFTLHGEKEDTENFRQICIREEQPTKFLPYIQCTLDSDDPYNPADVNACMKSLGIDSAKVDSCIATKAPDYYAVDSGLSTSYGVQGSPTLVINGVQADSQRSAAGVLQTICSAFTTAPAECSEQLATDQASPGFGYSSSGSDTAAVQCGF